MVSFIPRYVSNRACLRAYQMLAAVPIPRRTREKNYNANVERLKGTDWDFWSVPSAYIENQNEWDKIAYGAGSHQNMRYSGCEIIATFNAWKMLTGAGTRESMAALIREYEKYGAALRGEFGVSPRAIETYFRKHGFPVAATDKDDRESLNRVAARSRVMIATVYNDAGDITKQVHTICITKDEGKGYVLHNAYRRDKDGTYVASVPYATVADAISNISGREVKLIYLIGIAAAESKADTSVSTGQTKGLL